MNKHIKRVLRVLAFAVGSGIVFIAAGSVGGMSPFDAALIGATGAIMVIAVAVLFEYAGKGQVSDEAFDEAINTGIQKVKADTEKKKN
jgi:peptidoglycan/LPS O-acetylase OafA/YrhL